MIKKRFLSMFVLLAAVVMGAWAQGTQVTFVPGEFDAKTNEAYQLVKQGITIAVSNGSVTQNQFRVFKNATFTVTSTVGNIKSVELTAYATGETKYGPGCLTTPTTGQYTFESEGYKGTWTGDAATFTLTASKNQIRVTQIVVTIGEAATGINDVKVNGAEKANWYDLSGRPLNGKPTKTGAYVKNGKKVVIK
ncbi:hypothetical protein [Segatella bryantii]|uniref:hypothetical protein n=1 Tax=Segatella bryantii TaxID=77095 RepID=UPI000881F9F5|nr:hypothetical protein [Segatella bryantii]SDL97051.1 hypothetical protein SAMN04487899_11141 [Segatella bryantii]